MAKEKHDVRFTIYCTKAQKKAYLKAWGQSDWNSASDWARSTLDAHLYERSLPYHEAEVKP